MPDRIRFLIILTFALLAACALAPDTPAPESALPEPTRSTPALVSTAELSRAPTQTARPFSAAPASTATSRLPEGTALARETPPALATLEFPNTNFSLHNVSYDDIISGGPPRDGIRPLDDPAYVDVAAADTWLSPLEPVILVELGGQARAYPIQILIYHELANTEIAGQPILVSFCPLCNTAIVFSRQLDDQALTFSTTGRLRFSNLIMYDRQSESWWQQATGQAIAGQNTGAQLDFLPASIIAWQDFRSAFPTGLVLSRATGSNRQYGLNPYLGYDDINDTPFLYEGPPVSGRLPPLARVLTVDLNNQAVAYPFTVLAQQSVINDYVGGQSIVVFWQAGAVSPLDTLTIETGRAVGAAAAYSRQVDEAILTFRWRNGVIKDEQTGSEWLLTGLAIRGPLAGTQLRSVLAINHFWFSWAAFRPETQIYSPASNQ